MTQQQQKQPRNILEQILFGQEITNDNVVTLADNLAALNEKLDLLLLALSPQEPTEPIAPGTVNNEGREQ
ncbi:MAG: hypothetical protein IJF01_07170 [Tidjanibacter sp.]|nr:hypothetical protein [Tidjanibacter sp.]